MLLEPPIHSVYKHLGLSFHLSSPTGPSDVFSMLDLEILAFEKNIVVNIVVTNFSLGFSVKKLLLQEQ